MIYNCRRFLWTAVAVFVLSIFGTAQDNIQNLEPNKPIESELKGGETHSYRITLAAGQYLHAVAEQKGIDVVVIIFAPDGKKLLEVYAPNGTKGQLPVWFVAETGGDYKLEVVSLKKDATAGKYEVSIKELRAGTSDDKFFAEGQRMFEETFRLQSESKPESFAKAIEKLEDAGRLFRLINDKKRRASSLVRMGKIYQSLSQHEKAIEFFHEAQVLFEDAGLYADSVDTIFSATLDYQLLDKNTDGLNSFKKALALSLSIGDKKRQAFSHNFIGVFNKGLGDYAEALRNLQQGLKISEEIEYKDGILLAMQDMGNVYRGQGNYGRALEVQYKLLYLLEEWVSKNLKPSTLPYEFRHFIPSTLLNIGTVFFGQRNYEQALEHYQKAFAAFEASKLTKFSRGSAIALVNIGEVFMYQGQYEQAFDYFKKSREIMTGLGLKDLTSESIGIIYLHQGKYDDALEIFKKNLETYQNLKMSYFAANTMEDMASVYYSQKHYTKALEFVKNAINIAERYDYHDIYWSASTILAKVFLALGQKKEAKQILELAIRRIENLRALVAGNESEQQRFFVSRTEPYQLMVDLLNSQSSLEDALAYTERTKSRTLLENLQDGKINITKAMTVQEQERERSLKSELVSLNAQISKDNERIRLSDLQHQLEKKRLEFEDFQIRLYASHPELKVQRGEMKPITLEETGALLQDAKSAMLEFVVAEDKTFLFVITKDAAKKVSLKAFTVNVKGMELGKRVEAYRSKIASGDLDFQKSSRELYDLLLKPASAQLTGKTNLIIVPDGPLWDLPFEALQNEKNKYLVEQAAVSYAPSLTALKEMSKMATLKKPGAGLELLAFGNPIVGKETAERVQRVFMSEKLEPIPEAERLVNELGKMYGPNRSKVYIGDQAREETAKTESPKYRIVQFATHGILNNVSPMYSHLVLAQNEKNPNEDGLLEAWEMKDLDLKADMVILSACETARGRISNGEGVIGMSWAMFIAGTPTTVASQWKVESKSTTELMLEFHRQLLAGKKVSKAEALRRASLKVMKMPGFKHPSYWAGFVIVGDGS